MTELSLVETTRTNVPQATLKIGHTEFTVPEDKRLQIKNTNDDGYMFNEKCPDGKSWTVVVSVRIIETDA